MNLEDLIYYLLLIACVGGAIAFLIAAAVFAVSWLRGDIP